MLCIANAKPFSRSLRWGGSHRREAERLLSASATGRDELLVMAILAGAGVAQVLPVLAHVALTAFPAAHRLVAALAAFI